MAERQRIGRNMGVYMDTSTDSELRTHQEMWHNFVKLMGYSAVAIAALLSLMALFLA